MKKFRGITALLLCVVLIGLTGCKSLGNLSNGGDELRICISEADGNFNPFYSENEGDNEIISQMFRPIQRRGTDNKLINYSGGISYEITENNQVKYTVSIKDDMFFSDGTNITIDDVIFFYHFISDAKYDGIYSDWYLNDIVGLKEYYFDDKNYASAVSNIEKTIEEKYTVSSISTEDYEKYLTETKLEGKFTKDLDSVSPSGKSWKEYISNAGYEYKLKQLGDTPDENELLALVAKIEAETNRYGYNPEDSFREKLYNEYIDKNYSDGINISEIEGIKKVNDYTCTVLFNSKNINDISKLNVLLVPSDYLSAEYIKGSPEKIKEIQNIAISSGAYVLGNYDENEITMSANKYFETECEFDNLKFIISDDPVKSLKNEKADIATVTATSQNIEQFKDERFAYVLTNQSTYSSLFFNLRTLDVNSRKALMCLCSDIVSVEEEIGPYYTRLYSPLSIRFSENPHFTENSIYNESSFELYYLLAKNLDSIKAYCPFSENTPEYSTLSNLKDKLKQKNITLEIVLTDSEKLDDAINSGEADIWIEKVDDGATCDKYDYYNSSGKSNKTAFVNTQADELTVKIRSSVGLVDKSDLTKELLELVMEQAVEYPLYQLQNMTVYNVDLLDSSCVTQANNYDGFTYVIPLLEKKKG